MRAFRTFSFLIVFSFLCNEKGNSATFSVRRLNRVMKARNALYKKAHQAFTPDVLYGIDYDHLFNECLNVFVNTLAVEFVLLYELTCGTGFTEYILHTKLLYGYGIFS